MAIDPPAFGAEQIIQAAGGDLQVYAYSVPEVADWNNDGAMDLIVGEQTSSGDQGKVRVYLNTGSTAQPVYAAGVFVQAEGADLSVPAGGCLGVFPRVMDYNDDGLKDLLLGMADGRVQVRLNQNTDADPLFGPADYVQVGPPGSKGNANFGFRATLDVVDWNNDGRLDLVLGEYGGLVRVLVDQAASGVPDFQSAIVVQDAAGDLTVPSGRSSPAVFDLDGDGLKDLITGNTEGQLLLYANTGTDAAPVFDGYVALQSDALPIDLPGTPRSRPWVGDANGDGEPEILLGAQDGSLRLYTSGRGAAGRAEARAAGVELLDAAGNPVQIAFDENTVLVGAATWCSACNYFKQLIATPELAAELTGLRIIFAFGDEGGGGLSQFSPSGGLSQFSPSENGTVPFDVSSLQNPDFLQNLPGEVLFLSPDSPARPSAFPTVYDPARGEFTSTTAFEWVQNWLSGSPLPLAAEGPGCSSEGTGATDVLLAAGDFDSPAPFEILGPSGTVDDATPEISWEASAGAIGYDVVISTEMDLSVPVVEFFDVTETSVTPADPLDDGTYYIGVTAVAPNQTPQVDAGPDVTIHTGEWLVGSGSFTDPEHRVDASNNGLSFEVGPAAYHHIFITSDYTAIDENETFPPNFPAWGGLQAADYTVTYTAYMAGLIPWDAWDFMTPIYTAILSTPTVNARDRLVIEGEIRNVAGELVAADDAQLWSGSLSSPVKYDEFGQLVPTGTDIWTGTFSDGTWSQDSCDAWNSTSGNATGGNPDGLGSAWIQGPVTNCNGFARLYAISPLLGVAPTVDAGPDAMAVVDQSFTRDGTFDDLGDVYWTATVDYGDGGGPQPLTLDFQAHSFQLAHTYTTSGPHTVTVTINDSDPGTDAGVATFEVEVQQGPGPFAITGPVGQIVIETPTVTWEPSTGATGYDVVISTTPDGSTPVQTYNDLSTTSRLLDPLANGTYYVSVTAEDDFSNSTTASNNGFSFTVSVNYPAPLIITGPVSPVETETPTVTWEASANATGYNMIVGRDMECQNPVATYEDLAVTSQLLDPMENGTYYVCVTAFDASGHELTATNNGFAFSVLVLPPGPFLITGPAAAVNGQTATITWEVSERAIEYDLVVSTVADCSVAIGEDYPGLTSLSQETGTLANGTYYACVTARDDDGRTSTATNNGFSFEIAYVPPKFHNIFMTSTHYSIDTTQSFPPNTNSFGGLQAADWQCTYRAFRGGLVSNWDGLTIVYKAILSTPTVNARDRMVIEGEVVNLAGELVAASGNDLWAGNLQNTVGYDEYGNPLGIDLDAWTGSDGSGSHSGASCSGWSVTTGSGTTGDPASTTTPWLNNSSQTCNLSAHIYCLSPALKELKGSGVFVSGVTGGRNSEATTTADRFDLPASALQLVDAAGEPVRIELNQDSVLIGTATWCSASAMLKQMLAEPEVAAQLAGLRIVFALGDEGGEGPGGTVNAEYLEDLPGEVVFLTDRSQTRPTAFPTVYDPAQNRFTNQTAFEWIDQWLARRGATINDSDPGTAAVTTFEVATAMADPVLWTATVDYDDGAGPVPLSLNPDKTFALSHQYAVPGIYTVTVTVTDDEGAVGIDTLTVTVDNVAPTADAGGPYTIDVGGELALDGSGSYDPGNDITLWAWDLDDDGQFDDASGEQPVIDWATLESLGLAYPADPVTGLPNNPVDLRVEDSYGAAGTASTTLTIYQNQPVASFTAHPNPAACSQEVSFDASLSSHGHPDHEIVLYEWDWDYDGSTFDVETTGASARRQRLLRSGRRLRRQHCGLSVGPGRRRPV